MKIEEGTGKLHTVNESAEGLKKLEKALGDFGEIKEQMTARNRRKKKILRGLSMVNPRYDPFDPEIFAFVRKRAETKGGLPDTLPEQIRRDLTKKGYKSGQSLRLGRDLALLVFQRRDRRFLFGEQIRVYFDKDKIYRFLKNEITGKWQEESVFETAEEKLYTSVEIPVELLTGTCGEKDLPSWEVDLGGTNLWELVARKNYTALEQAVKMDMKQVYDCVLDYVTNKKPENRDQNLPEMLGISGPQLKYLRDVPLTNVGRFREAMKDERFIRAFPDIKKRIFAANFYQRSFWNEETEELFWKGTKTVNSLERSEPKERNGRMTEYADYLQMLSKYRKYMKQPRRIQPIAEELKSFGSFEVNMKPSRIRENNYRLARVLSLMEESENIKMHTARIKDRWKREADQREYTNGEYEIRMPEDAETIVAEGRVLQHCVGSAGYIEAMAFGRSTILFLRKCSEKETPLLTLEERGGRILQCYGFRDRINSDPGIRDFITEYAKVHHYRIEAQIYKEGA